MNEDEIKKHNKNKLNLVISYDSNIYKKYDKSSLNKSPRQKYLEKHFGCDFDENDILTLVPFKKLPPIKIKYLTVLKNNKISHCFDTIPFYNYILDSLKNKKLPKNLLTNKELTDKELSIVFKNIKHFTKKETLNNINEDYLDNFNNITDPYKNINEPEIKKVSSKLSSDKKDELLKKYNSELKRYNKKLIKKNKEYKIESISGNSLNKDKSFHELKLDKSLKISKKSLNSENKIDKIKKDLNLRKKYENKYLLYWIDIKKLNWDNLSENPNAINLLNNNFDKINWNRLSKNTNPKIINLLEKKINLDKKLSKIEYELLADNKKIDWYSLLLNPNIESFNKILRYNKTNLSWNIISKNPNAINLIKDHIKFEDSLGKLHNLKDFELINYDKLCENPNAIDLLEKRYEFEKKLNKFVYRNLSNYKKLNWSVLSKNPNAINLLKKKNKDEKLLSEKLYNELKDNEKINWINLSQNPNAINLLKNNLDKIDDWFYILKNPNSGEILKKNLDKIIDWSILSEYINDIYFLKNNKNFIDYNGLSKNSNVKIIDLLKEKNKEINWNFLSENSNYEIIDILKKRINFEKKLSKIEYNNLSDKLNWYYLSKNKYLINSLKNNLNKINWDSLSENPNIFLFI